MKGSSVLVVPFRTRSGSPDFQLIERKWGSMGGIVRMWLLVLAPKHHCTQASPPFLGGHIWTPQVPCYPLL